MEITPEHFAFDNWVVVVSNGVVTLGDCGEQPFSNRHYGFNFRRSCAGLGWVRGRRSAVRLPSHCSPSLAQGRSTISYHGRRYCRIGITCRKITSSFVQENLHVFDAKYAQWLCENRQFRKSAFQGSDFTKRRTRNRVDKILALYCCTRTKLARKISSQKITRRMVFAFIFGHQTYYRSHGYVDRNEAGMSVRVISMVWETKCDSYIEKLVLVALADNANDERIAFPSVKTLAVKCDLSESGVKLQLKKLAKKGLINVRSTTGRISNEYTVLPSQPVTGVTGHVDEANPSRQNSNQSPWYLKPVTQVTANHIEPSNEPITSKTKIMFNGELKVECQDFVNRWMSAQEEDFKERAVRPDKTPAKLISLCAQGFKAAELVNVARAAWKNKDGWYCERSVAMDFFLKHFENIRGELKNGNKTSGRSGSKNTGSRTVGTINEGKTGQYARVGTLVQVPNAGRP